MGRRLGYSRFFRLLSSNSAPILVVSLQGGIDAGRTAEIIANHLTASLVYETVGQFDVDALLDYRSRRPMISFENGRLIDYEQPYMRVDKLKDDEGNNFFLLHGVEPDLAWDTLASDLLTFIETQGVEVVVVVSAVSWSAPHTRPVQVLARSSRDGLLVEESNMLGAFQFPASFATILEARLTELKLDVVGYSAHVPQYLVQTEYPPAASAMVSAITAQTGLALPVGELEAAAAVLRSDVDAQVAQSKEAQIIVQALETQYDAMVHTDGQPQAMQLGQELPSADEIGAAVESFLARQDRFRQSSENDK